MVMIKKWKICIQFLRGTNIQKFIFLLKTLLVPEHYDEINDPQQFQTTYNRLNIDPPWISSLHDLNSF